MPLHPTLRAFNFENWIAENQHLLRPPVGNKLLHDETGMIVMIVGGPNTRTDFHDDPVQEWFFQYRGNMVLKIADGGRIHDVPIHQGEVFLLPPHTLHSPQRPETGSVGIVVEAPRMFGMREGFEWFCFECEARVHRAEVPLTSASGIVSELPKVYAAFHSSEAARTCPNCGAMHPGNAAPPEGWVTL